MRSNTHHIRPRSRGGKTRPGNLVTVDERKHAIYHQLFNNHTPDEIQALLEEFFPLIIANVVANYLSRTFWEPDE